MEIQSSSSDRWNISELLVVITLVIFGAGWLGKVDQLIDFADGNFGFLLICATNPQT